MRLSIWASYLGMALALAATPAEAEWQGYFNKDGVGFSFTAPGEMKAERTMYNSAMDGQREAIVFKSMENDIEFMVTIVDFKRRVSDGAALIKEASTAYQDNTNVLADADARVESSYGRKLTVDLPNNSGRSMSAIFFKDNHLIQLQAIVRPGGDLLSSDMGRFVDSLAFYETRSDEGAIELKLPD